MRVILILFGFVLLFNLVYAVPVIEFQNEDVQVGETILAKIYTNGEFVQEIKKEDIKFYEGRREVFFEYDLRQYDGDYYFYAIINREGNFTIEISNVLYSEGGQLGGMTIKKDIEVKDKIIFYLENEINKTKTEILQIKPGIVFSKDFANIDLINKGNSSFNLTYFDNKISILPGQTKNIKFIPNLSFSYFEVSTYKNFKIPIIFIGNLDENNQTNNGTINETENITKYSLKTNLNNINLNLIAGKKFIQNFSLFNLGSEEINSIKLSSDVYFIKESKFDNIGANKNINVSFEINPKDAGNFKGFINISYKQNNRDGLILIPVEFFVLDKGSNETDFISSDKTCKELSGKVCESNYICDGDNKFAKGAVLCCVGTCVSKEDKPKGSGNTWALGLLIILLVGVTILYVYKKYSKTKSKSTLDKFKEKDVEYNKRINGGLSRN